MFINPVTSQLLKFVKSLTTEEKTYHLIGLMSGTSLDGLDIVYSTFLFKNSTWHFQIKSATTVDFPDYLSKKLKNAISYSGVQLSLLDVELGEWIGKKVAAFIDIEKIEVDLIASHGHTIFHQPDKGLTYQIGNLTAIYKETNIPVIGDFRTLDVTLGGQGAPLVPIGDQYLFSEFDYCLNLGGISNISFQQHSKRVAYDICPVNIVLNHLANLQGLPFDKDGQIAAQGIIDHSLLNQLNNLDFYQDFKPKSLGIEWINEKIFPVLNSSDISIENKLHTFCHHIGIQLNRSIENTYNDTGSKKLLISGGGAFNSFLIETIKSHIANHINCIVPDKEIVAYKEALIFGLMGLLRWKNQVNVLSSVTGAAYDSSSGIIVDNLLI